MMLNEVSTIESTDIREFGIALLDEVPDYFFTVPASSSGKYHPKGDLGEGGLVRHSICVKKIIDHLLELNQVKDSISVRENDMLRLAALFHDCMKSGTQEDWKNCKHTSFFHPILAANFIMLQAAKNSFDFDLAKSIADIISTHMGQWNKTVRCKGLLPLPETESQKLLHLADYIASRQDINIDLPAPEDYDEPIDLEIDDPEPSTEDGNV